MYSNMVLNLSPGLHVSVSRYLNFYFPVGITNLIRGCSMIYLSLSFNCCVLPLVFQFCWFCRKCLYLIMECNPCFLKFNFSWTVVSFVSEDVCTMLVFVQVSEKMTML